MTVLFVVMFVMAGILGFATVAIGIAITVEYDWPRRLLGLVVCAIGISVIFINMWLGIALFTS